MSLKTASQNRVSNFTFTNSRTGGGGIGAGSVAITSIIVTDSNFNNLDDTAVATTNSYIKIVGTGFNSSANVFVSGSKVVSANVTYVNSTELRVALPTASGLGNTNIFVFNPDNSGAIWAPGLLVSGTPDFTQTSYVTTTPLTVSVQLVGTGDAPLTYELQSGSTLPAGLSLSSSGLISGSTVDGIYQFTVIISDAQLQSFQFLITLTVTSTDEYFNRTVLAINGDSNSFVTDVSPNGFSATISGDTKPHTFSPYDTNWSNFFDGTGDYLSVPNNAAFDLAGGDFTIECWVYPTTWNATAVGIFGKRSSTAIANQIGLEFAGSGGTIRFAYNSSGSEIGVNGAAGTLNAWQHIAVVRNGSTLTIYKDGVSTGTATINVSITTNTDALAIGVVSSNGSFPITGYISNFRIVKGTAVYTSAFTPSTTPLTAITNTSLLTCKSNRLIDNSTNNFAITKAGDVKVLTFGPFTETDTTTGSGFFDGSGDYLTIADNAALEPSNLDWTIEAWIYPTSNASNTYYAWFSKNGTGYGAFYFAQRNLGFYIFLSYTGSAWDVHGVNSNYSCGTMTLNAWNHIAITRSGQTVRGFLNGVLGTTITLSSAGVSLVDQANPLMLGAQSNGGEPVAGYMSNFRYVRGTSLYTSNFTPPTSQLTAVANTAVLTLQNFQSINNHTFIDESALRNNVTRNGNPSMGSFSPFSPARWSNFFDGSGDTLTLSRTVLTDLSAASAWTIEFWAFKTATSASAYSLIMSTDASGNSNGSVFSLNNANFVVGGQGHAGFPQLSTPANSTSVDRWHHIAIVKNSGTLKIYIDGVERASATQSTTFPNVADLMLGNRSSADLPFTGYISNLRVVNGTAVYTSAFTSPTSELTAIANTTLLMCQSNRFKDYSNNNFSITRNGDTRVTNFSPFKPTAQYSLATHGGAAYFDGSDYLQTNSTDSGLITTGPFTIELWIYPLSLNTTILSRFYWQTGDNGGWILSTNSSGFIVFGYSNGSWNTYGGITTTSNPIKINEWNHIAITRDSSNTLRVFVNGLSSVTPITLAQSLDTVAVQQAAVQPRTFRVAVGGLGDGALSGYYTGYISSVKIQTGVAKYTANSTPALQTFPNESGINYLSNMNTMGIVDITSRNFMETIGNVSLNSTKKFGTGSMSFDGTGDYLLVPNSHNFDLSTINFTIELWVKTSSTTAYQTALRRGDTWTTGSWSFYINDSNGNGNPSFWSNTLGTSFTCSGAVVNDGNWHHVALVRNGSSFAIYIDGISRGTLTNSGSLGVSTTSLWIGRDASNVREYNGQIDDLRITKFARYTANFTAPTLTFLTQ